MVGRICTWILETAAREEKKRPRSRASLTATPKAMDDPLAAMESK